MATTRFSGSTFEAWTAIDAILLGCLPYTCLNKNSTHNRTMPSYRVELHSHCKGDPIDRHLQHSLFEHIDHAKAVGLDAIAVTWHRKVCDSREAIEYARERGVLLIPGMEADVDGNRHLVVLN